MFSFTQRAAKMGHVSCPGKLKASRKRFQKSSAVSGVGLGIYHFGLQAKGSRRR